MRQCTVMYIVCAILLCLLSTILIDCNTKVNINTILIINVSRCMQSHRLVLNILSQPE